MITDSYIRCQNGNEVKLMGFGHSEDSQTDKIRYQLNFENVISDNEPFDLVLDWGSKDVTWNVPFRINLTDKKIL